VTRVIANGPDGGEQVAPPVRPLPAAAASTDTDVLLLAVARGDERAFERVYELLAPRVYGLVRHVVRDPSQAEEVAQEAFVEVWRTAARFDPARGSATAWVSTIAHHRAVDRVRSERAATDRMRRVAAQAGELPYDEVFDETIVGLEHQQVRRCLRTLTPLQREAITLAYYRGYTYREAADRLGIGLPTVKTRMRDGLIRLRDCLGVSIG
jgi:RNA polymerase sigma-70 factor (ECF subfamily)